MSYSNGITLRQLEVLNGIAAAGSMRKAAKILGLTQPTISAQLAKLEEALGTRLVHRDRSRNDPLTSAGELWARTARSVLADLERGSHLHGELFGQHRFKISFATMPSHSGAVLGLAAAQAQADPTVSDFSICYAPCSTSLLEYLDVRKANVALMAMTGSLAELPSYKTQLLYRDRILWAVPKAVDPAVALAVVNGGAERAKAHEALSRRVVVGVPHEWRGTSDAWFAASLPSAMPYFSCDLHLGAVEVVAAGLATCHVSLTLHRNLPERIRRQVAFYDIGRAAQDMVLAMPRHLATVPTFAGYFDRLSAAIRQHYAVEEPVSGD